MNLYLYRVEVVEVYDGDTITVNIDLGFGMWMKNQKVRLYGINTPELRGEEKAHGKWVRDWVRDRILGKTVIIESHKDKSGKYGRWLATVFYTPEGYLGIPINLNEQLVREGLAEEYMKE